MNNDDLILAFEGILGEAKSLWVSKLAAYGTANVAAYGMTGVVCRLQDKLARLTNGGHGTDFRDALLDCLNYAAMGLLILDGRWPMAQTDHQPNDGCFTGPLHSPKRPADVGHDLPVSTDTLVRSGQWTKVPSGVRVATNDGLWYMIVGRSSAAMSGLMVQPGVVDPGYTGELFAVVWNPTAFDIKVLAGDRIAQLVFFESKRPVLASVAASELVGSRGDNGFGSTGGTAKKVHP